MWKEKDDDDDDDDDDDHVVIDNDGWMQVAAEDATYQAMAERHTREAGEIADMTLRHVVGMCVPGAKANDVCRLGDSYMIRRLRERFPGLVAADSFPDTAQFSTKKKAGARTRVTAADLTPKNDTVSAWAAAAPPTPILLSKEFRPPGSRPPARETDEVCVS